MSGTTEVKVDYLENLDESTGSLPADIQGLVKFSPEGLVFDRPIQVSMPLNQPAQGKTDIVYWSAGDERWYITDRGETAGGEVTFYVDHFSSYASIGGGWSDIFSAMDVYVGGSDNEEAISNAVKRFLEQELWEEMGMKDLHFAAHTSAGNSCAKACGLYGFWSSEQGGKTRQGGGTIHEKSKHNLVSVIAMSNSQMTSHLQSETQIAADRIIEMYGEPCATELTGSASPATIEKGKKTTVTIKAHCDGSPLADQLIQLSYSPELSCSTVNKKTDSNGEIEISVKGEEEGTGYVYAKAVSTIDPEIETEIQIPVKVGGGENWEVEWRVNVQKSATASNFTPTQMGKGLGVANISVENTTHTLSYDIVGSATFSIKNNRTTGKFNLSVENVQYGLPEWKASWDYVGDNGSGVVGHLIYNVPFDVQYELQPKTDIPFQSVNRDYVSIYLSEDDKDWEDDVILKDNTTVTSTYIKSYIDGRVTDASMTTPKLYDFMSGIRPFAIYLSLEEGTFNLTCNDEISPKADADGRYNLFSLWANDFDFPYDNFSLLYTQEITGSVSTSKSATGTITIRQVDANE